MFSLYNLTDFFTFVGIAAPIIWGFWLYIVKPAINQYKKLTSFLKDIEEVHRIVKYEFKPNGGKSIRDSLDRIERTQHTFESRNKAMLNYTNLCLYECDSSGRILWVNTSYLRLVDKSTEEVLGWNWENSIHPDDRPEAVLEWEGAVRQGREYIAAYRILDGDGEAIPVTVQALPLRTPNGDLAGFFGSIRTRE